MHGGGLELALVFLLAAVIAVPVFRRFGLGAVLGYLTAGVALGPYGLRFVANAEPVLAAAEIGVVMLLFVIGLELSPARLRVMRKPVKVLGYCDQALPNNWKLYMGNVKDPYHASLLHTFFTTFRINRLSQPGGIIIDGTHTGHHVSYSKIERGQHTASEYEKTELRSRKEDYRLADPSVLDGVDEFGDGITLQILAVFPNFILQQIQNAVAVRQIVPRAVDKTDLNWTYLGFADDTAEQRLVRMKQNNLVGPAGYISMEDGCVGGFVQRGIAGASEEEAILEMGGSQAQSSESRVTEASVRGFWKAYRSNMGM